MDLERRARIFAALGDPYRLAVADELSRSDRTSAELADLVGLPSNLLAHHLKVLEGAGLLERRRSEGDGRRRYLVLGPLTVSVGRPIHRRPATVLFVCRRNSARSQFAAAMWRARTGWPGQSAGPEPARHVHPLAVRVAAEQELDLMHSTPKGFQDIEGKPDLVVTVCDVANEGPIPFSVERRHWSIEDPLTIGRIGAFRSSFSDISARIDRLQNEFAATE